MTDEKISIRLESIASQIENKLYILEHENKLLKDEINFLISEHEYLCKLILLRKNRLLKINST